MYVFGLMFDITVKSVYKEPVYKELIRLLGIDSHSPIFTKELVLYTFLWGTPVIWSIFMVPMSFL